MNDAVDTSPSSTKRPSAFRVAARFLFRTSRDFHELPPAPSSAVHWFVPLGLFIGVAWMTAFRIAWRSYGDPEYKNDRALPALAVLVAECLLLGRPLLRGLTRSAGPDEDSRSRGLAVTFLWMLALWAVIERLPARTGWYAPDEDWRSWLNSFYPLATYRPLILAPLWGRWAMLLAGCVGRCAPDADQATRGLCSALKPSVVLRWSLVPFALTALFLGRDGLRYEGLFTGFVTFLATYLAAVYFSRRHAGQTRDTLFACAAIAEIVFLAVFRWTCIPQYW